MSKLAKFQAAAKARQVALAHEHTLTIGAAAAGLAYAEGRGMQLPSVPGVPLDPKAQWAIALAVLADSKFVSGRSKRFVRSAADGLVAISAYEYVRGMR